MAFDGKEGEAVTLEDASRWTANFRNENPDPGTIKAHFMGKDLIKDITRQQGCKGIRIYNAVNDAGEAVVVIVGAESNEDDQIGSSHTIAERSRPCPPICGANNALNS